MNLPNKLTVLRVIMIPFFIFFLMYKEGENAGFRVAALTIFIIAALTDTLDGIIARKYNLITNEKSYHCNYYYSLLRLNGIQIVL